MILGDKELYERMLNALKLVLYIDSIDNRERYSAARERYLTSWFGEANDTDTSIFTDQARALTDRMVIDALPMILECKTPGVRLAELHRLTALVEEIAIMTFSMITIGTDRILATHRRDAKREITEALAAVHA